MNVSDAGVEFIANFEGFRSEPYWDVDHFSIGYGTRARSRDDGPISRAEGIARLKRRIAEDYEPAVDSLDLDENQNRYDALVSFVFNLGPGVLEDRVLGGALRRKQWDEAADALLAYDKSGGRVLAGLTRRREQERALFKRIAYTDDERVHLSWLKQSGPNPVARTWLEDQARRIKTAALKSDPHDWQTRDRGRRYQGIRRALNHYR